MWMGETPKNVTAVFRKAREEEAVLRGPAERPGEPVGVPLAAGAPGRAPGRLLELEARPVPRRAAAPEAPAAGPGQGEGPRVEPVSRHHGDAQPERRPRAERLASEEPQHEGHRQEQEESGGPGEAHAGTAITERPARANASASRPARART